MKKQVDFEIINSSVREVQEKLSLSSTRSAKNSRSKLKANKTQQSFSKLTLYILFQRQHFADMALLH